MFTFPFGFMAAVSGGGPDAELVVNVSLTNQDIRIGQSPISLSGLESETYDYYGFLRINNTTGSGDLIPRFNAGVGTFADIQMRAQASTPSGNTNAASSAPALTSIDGTSILFEFRITGTIAGSRIISYQSGYKSGSTTGMHSGKEAWSDTANEITSFDLYSTTANTFDYDYIVYRVPKVGNQGNWEFLDSLGWAAEASTKSFTGLSLDADKEYRVSVESETGDYLHTKFNSSAGNVYTNANLKVLSSTLSAASTLTDSLEVVGSNELIIRGATGDNRSVLANSLKLSTNELNEISATYENTVTDITEINCNVDAASITATANLYKAKAGLTGDAMPFELVEERVLVGADLLNNPEVFSSLAGNSVDVFKIDFELTASSSVLILFGNFNGSLNNDIQTNILRSFGTSPIATEFLQPVSQVCYINPTPTIFSLYLYPKSGAERPYLLKCGTHGADGVEMNHAYWTNTVDELEAFAFSGTSSSGVNGTIRLSKLIAN